MDPGAKAKAEEMSRKLQQKLGASMERITRLHQQEIGRLQRAVGPVQGFQGTIGKL